MLKPRNSVQTQWGLCPQTPGIYRFRAEIFCSILTGRLAPPRPSQPPSRRSGRIPALPYPPLGSTIHIGRTLSTLTSAVSANNHAGQFRQHSSRQLNSSRTYSTFSFASVPDMRISRAPFVSRIIRRPSSRVAPLPV